jgi:hypothetical protein
MNSLKTLLLLFAVLCATVMARDLKSPKSSKSSTLKSTKGPKASKKTKSPSDSKGSKLSSKAPTMKSNKSSKGSSAGGGDVFVSIGVINFDDLADDEILTTYQGLVWSGFKSSPTNPAAPSTPNAGIPLSSSATFELASGVFSMTSVDIAGQPGASPVTINGFNSAGTQTVTKLIAFTTVYQTYDVSEFTNVAKVEFVFGTTVAGIDNVVLL